MADIPGVNATSGGSQDNVLQSVLGLLAQTMNKGNNPTVANITGGDNAANPTKPDPLVTMQTHIPGAGTPMPQRQYPDIKTSSGEFATRSGNRRNALNNMMGNIAGIVTTANKNAEAQKTRNLSLDLERLMTAATNPDDPQNAQVINDILGDAKKRKSIMKALDISFLGSEDKRDPISKGALQMALGKLKQQGVDTGNDKLSDLSKVIMSKFPRSPQLSPEAQATMALTKAGVLPGAKEKTDIKKTELNNATKEKIADQLVGLKSAEMQVKALTTIAQIYGRQAATEIAANARIKDAQLKTDAYNKRTQAMLDMTESKIKALGTTGKGASQADKNKLTALKEERDTINARLKAITNNKKGFDKAGYEKAIRDLETNSKKIEMLGADLGVGDDSGLINSGEQSGAELEQSITGGQGSDSTGLNVFDLYKDIVGAKDDGETI